MKETLETALKKLRLSGLASTLDVRLQEAKVHIENPNLRWSTHREQGYVHWNHANHFGSVL